MDEQLLLDQFDDVDTFEQYSAGECYEYAIGVRKDRKKECNGMKKRQNSGYLGQRKG